MQMWINLNLKLKKEQEIARYCSKDIDDVLYAN